MVENNAGGTWIEFVYGPTGRLAKANGQTLIKAYIALPGAAKAIYNSSGLAYYRHSDWLGSSRLTSTASAPTSAYSTSAYGPFGEQYAPSGNADASFTGQDQDSVSSLFDFWARRQSYSQGRWISPDPAGSSVANPKNPQSWNRYTYVENLGTSVIDQAGLYGNPCNGRYVCIDPSSGGGNPFAVFDIFVAANGMTGYMDCGVNGIPTSCGPIMGLMQVGAAAQCPQSECVTFAGGQWQEYQFDGGGAQGYISPSAEAQGFSVGDHPVWVPGGCVDTGGGAPSCAAGSWMSWADFQRSASDTIMQMEILQLNGNGWSEGQLSPSALALATMLSPPDWLAANPSWNEKQCQYFDYASAAMGIVAIPNAENPVGWILGIDSTGLWVVSKVGNC